MWILQMFIYLLGKEQKYNLQELALVKCVLVTLVT